VLAFVCAAVLVAAVVGRSGLPDADGTLRFFGRDNTFDPLFYLAVTRHLLDAGLPLQPLFVSGEPITHSYLPFGLRAGVAAAGGASKPSTEGATWNS
jgi:hypothetical protein